LLETLTISLFVRLNPFQSPILLITQSFIYQKTRRHNRKVSKLQQHRCDKPKFRLYHVLSLIISFQRVSPLHTNSKVNVCISEPDGQSAVAQMQVVTKRNKRFTVTRRSEFFFQSYRHIGVPITDVPRTQSRNKCAIACVCVCVCVWVCVCVRARVRKGRSTYEDVR
jgi:hypothetical protein